MSLLISGKTSTGVETPLLVDAAGMLLSSATLTSVTITPINLSGTITSGDAAQTLHAADSSGKTVYIRNVSAGDLWFDETGQTAIKASPSHKLSPTDEWESPGKITTAISIIGATTGQNFTARKW